MDFLIDGQISSFCSNQSEAEFKRLIMLHKLTKEYKRSSSKKSTHSHVLSLSMDLTKKKRRRNDDIAVQYEDCPCLNLGHYGFKSILAPRPLASPVSSRRPCMVERQRRSGVPSILVVSMHANKINKTDGVTHTYSRKSFPGVFFSPFLGPC